MSVCEHETCKPDIQNTSPQLLNIRQFILPLEGPTATVAAPTPLTDLAVSGKVRQGNGFVLTGHICIMKIISYLYDDINQEPG